MDFLAETSAKTSEYNVVSPYNQQPWADVIEYHAFILIQSKNRFPAR
jgi:hypothetical protein